MHAVGVVQRLRSAVADCEIRFQSQSVPETGLGFGLDDLIGDQGQTLAATDGAEAENTKLC